MRLSQLDVSIFERGSRLPLWAMVFIALKRGMAGDQTLLKSYLSEGLRRDEAQFEFSVQPRMLEKLKRLGVPQALLDEATRELTAS